MTDKERILEEFTRFMDGAPDCGGDRIFARLGVPPRTLDEILLGEFGMTADEILAEYRRKKRSFSIDIGDNIY